MQTLRKLADDGRSVVVVTHSVANLELCHYLLVLAPGGRLAYFGPPGEALHYFGQSDYADLFLMLQHDQHTDWTGQFLRSDLYKRLNADHPRGRTPLLADRNTGPRQQPAWAQFAVLSRRYLAVIAADRQYLVFLAVLPVALSLLARTLPGDAGLSTAQGSPQPAQLILILIIGASLMGSAAAVRELVKEREIYRRERAIGLSLGAYLGSKITCLAGIVGIQTVLFAVLAVLGDHPPDSAILLSDPALEVIIAVLAAALAALAVGLTISALIDNADRGMPLLVLLVMGQLVLCGGLFSVHGRAGLEQLSWFVPARWAFAMAAATINLNSPGSSDPLWDHTASVWLQDGLMLAVLTISLLGVTGLLLKRLDPRHSKR